MTQPQQPMDDSYPTRPSLLHRLKDTRDQQSWQEFHDTYRQLILGFAIKAGLTEDEAQEVVQETMIAAAKHLPEFKYDPKVCSFKTYLLNLCRWRIQDQLRKRQAPTSPAHSHPSNAGAEDSTRTATIERVPEPGQPALEALWDREWHTTLMEAALARVKLQCEAKQWQIFDLYALKDWSVREVAKAMGVNAATVYLTKHRVSVLLKKELRKLDRAR